MNLAPTASTTAALAMGDALAMTLLVEKGFKEADFATLHPGGRLGKRLLRVAHLMHTGDQCPRVAPSTRIREVSQEITRAKHGMACVVNGHDELLGLITDGDLRRHLERSPDIFSLTAADIMTRRPIVVGPDALAVEALNLMEQRKITALVVVTGEPARVAGVVHLHDLWKTELV
jgi:arabinose-5-phosphate isomerase